MDKENNMSIYNKENRGYKEGISHGKHNERYNNLLQRCA